MWGRPAVGRLGVGNPDRSVHAKRLDVCRDASRWIPVLAKELQGGDRKTTFYVEQSCHLLLPATLRIVDPRVTAPGTVTASEGYAASGLCEVGL